ncbi:MAG: hypothetical protein QM698_16110 [Micropepsaceae bacterium]
MPAFAPAWADEAPPPPVRTEPPVVGFIDTAKPFCYARTYDDAHMKAHPKQKVTGIALTYVPEKMFPEIEQPQKMWDQYADYPAFSANIVVTLKGKQGFLLGGAYCRTGSSKMLECGIEGDGGMFNVLLQEDGRVKLVNDQGGFTVSEPGVGMEEEDSEHYPIEPKDDHDAFLMSAEKGGLCDADW